MAGTNRSKRGSAGGDSPRTVKTTETSLRIIEYVNSHGESRVSEIADELDLTPSCVYKHLTTLTEANYLATEGDFYHLGLKFLELGNSVQYRSDVYRDIESRAEKLAEQTDNRVHFTVEEHGKGVHVFHKPGANRVWEHNTEGKRQYLHATAAGKAILSKLPEWRVDEIIDQHGLPELTERTITDREELFEELEAIRERGYARNDQETIEGIRAVGAPVTAPWGGVVGALSVGGPETSLRGEYWEEELPNTVAGSVNELELDLALS